MHVLVMSPLFSGTLSPQQIASYKAPFQAMLKLSNYFVKPLTFYFSEDILKNVFGINSSA